MQMPKMAYTSWMPTGGDGKKGKARGRMADSQLTSMMILRGVGESESHQRGVGEDLNLSAAKRSCSVVRCESDSISSERSR